MILRSPVRNFRFVICAALIFILWPAKAFAAGNFFIDTAVTYDIQSQELTHVEHRITVTNRQRSTYASNLTLYAAGDAANIRAKYTDGAAIPYTAEKEKQQANDIEYEATKITLNFPRALTGTNRSFTFTVDYDTVKFVIPRGTNASKIYIPTVKSNDDDRNYSVTVVAPASFGTPHFSVVGPDSYDTIGDENVITYSKGKLVNSGLFINFGDAAYYKFKLKYPLKNPIPFWKTIWLTLPPNMVTQEVYLNSLSRKPTSVKMDKDGNILAGFRLGPLQRAEVVADVTVKVKLIEFDLSIAGMIDEMPKSVAERYTIQDTYWETNAETVKRLADSVYDDKKNVAQNTKALYDVTVKTLEYNVKKLDFNTRLGAEKTLSEPANAVCMEYADTLIAMLRYKGIPARNPVGYAYDESLKPSDSVADSLHAWVEVFIPNVGWVLVDPTWGEKVDNFGQTDFDHVTFSVFGLESDKPAAAFVGNIDLGYQYENSEWSFGEVVEPKITAALSTLSLPLPGFVLIKANVENTGNTVFYGAELLAPDTGFYPKESVNFGDMAPLQQAEYYFVSAPYGLKNVSAAVGVSAAPPGELPLVLAEKDVGLPYLISLIELAVIILAAAALISLKVLKTIRKRRASG